VERRIDVDRYVDDRFIRRAASELGQDYEARLRNYERLPFSGNAIDTGAPVPDPNLAGQIWVKGEPRVRLYSSVETTFRALRQLSAEGKGVRVTFVHDRQSGNKLFADKVWYVSEGGKLSAFLLEPVAREWAKAHNGSVIGFDAAQKIAVGS
jgi:NitT/TauT family transport system substrate-binding protein